MLIEIHMIQNHSPANLNRDDLGAPKTCYFGGTLRSRISSQCLKRSIRMSDEFKNLLGGIRTRQLANLIAKRVAGSEAKARAEKILMLCGIKPKKAKNTGDSEESSEEKSKGLVYTSKEAIDEMAKLLQNGGNKTDDELARGFAELIAKSVYVPDMALSGRMLEPEESKFWDGLEKERTVEAALQVAHAFSTHEARPEVDYYVAADDVPGTDKGAGFVDEALFASACFYKYFSIRWEDLVKNLNGNKELAAHTVGAFIKGAALATPSGKKNSFNHNNRPSGILVELGKTPINYANAFVKPVVQGERDIVSQSIFQLGHFIHDMDVGYGKPEKRFWYSPNLQHRLQYRDGQQDKDLTENNTKSLEELISTVVREATGLDWREVQKVAVNKGEL
jgi:CRISPR system Cascade subunit CasC